MSMMLMGVGGPDRRLHDDYGGSAFDETNLVTYAFGGLAIGPADARRRVVVATISQGIDTSHNHTSLSGNAGAVTFAKIGSTVPSTSDNSVHVSLWEALVTSGTTIDLSFTAAAQCIRASVHWWMHGRGAAVASDGDSTSAYSVSLTIPPNGLAIAASAVPNATAGVPTWGGLPTIDNTAYHSAALNVSAGRRHNTSGAEETAQAITVAWSVAGPARLVGAAFGATVP